MEFSNAINVNPTDLIKAIFEVIDKYIATPFKEVLIVVFCLILLLGLVYGLLSGFGPRRPSSSGDNAGARQSDDGRDLLSELKAAQAQIQQLERNAEIDRLERYYLYFNGIANASLMLALALLLARYHVPAFFKTTVPVQQQIGYLLSLISSGIVASVIIVFLVDALTRVELGKSARRTNLINRAFLISFVVNAFIFLGALFGVLHPVSMAILPV
jgi:hypothetical protein